MTDDLPRIATDDDWIELRIGDHALIFGRLDAPCHPDSTAIMIVNSAWVQFVIEIGRTPAPLYPKDTDVCATIERCEDGMTLVTMRETSL